jgi:phosphoribosylamine---glycine ligase
VIGPEAPLVEGLADRLRADRRLVVGPGADGARLEGSKAWMKRLLIEAGVPTARYGSFDEQREAMEFLDTLDGPYVVKTDGLAAGKGVLVTESRGEAAADIEAKLSGRSFGEAGRRVIVEEGLSGPECSLLVLCDGRRVAPMALAQDYKRVGDGDEGPNTGGIGSYSPLPWAPPGLVDQLMEESVEPLVHALRRQGVDYRGVLYAGLMLTDSGPKVLEYNVRFGDPESQVVLPRLAADPVELLVAVAEGRLTSSVVDQLRFVEDAAVCVVMCSPGYPEAPKTGAPIGGLGRDGQLEEPRPGVSVIHAGTDRQGSGFVTAGGRVLGLVALGADVAAARDRAYGAAELVDFPGAHYRRDIAAGVDFAASDDVAAVEGAAPVAGSTS